MSLLLPLGAGDTRLRQRSALPPLTHTLAALAGGRRMDFPPVSIVLLVGRRGRVVGSTDGDTESTSEPSQASIVPAK